LCLPYLSLPYLDLLGDINVRGYVVGATNVLFKQKKQLIDVLVEVSISEFKFDYFFYCFFKLLLIAHKVLATIFIIEKDLRQGCTMAYRVAD
jgi:hypothetical protein